MKSKMRMILLIAWILTSNVSKAGGPPGPWPVAGDAVGTAEGITCHEAIVEAKENALENAGLHCRWLKTSAFCRGEIKENRACRESFGISICKPKPSAPR